MSNIDKRGLREAAEKATKGRWAVEFDDEIYSTDGVNHEQIAMVFSENEARDAAFIAAANPATVLALLDELEAAEKRIAELEARAFNPAILDVIAERQRQQSVEGWTPEHDNAYQNSELADAAACYAIHAHNQGFSTPAHWPWSPDWWKQSGARRDLVKAGALILAEIERIDRAAGIGVKGE
ncbi:ead/Ea22-like family protein [Escherichia coli]|nr:ead/Ea22-like family protein [Escherichia coli]